MTKEVLMTRDGGFYYRAIAFHWLVVGVVIIPAAVVVLLAMVNPFWFRSSMLSWCERTVNRIARWRDRMKYRVYLGADPAVWHALKD